MATDVNLTFEGPKFFCHHCGAEETLLHVSDAQQMRRVGGRQRLHAHVRCSDCKTEWWSRHKVALAKSRTADAMAKANG